MVQRQVRRVVLHEIALHFGISDERLIEIERYWRSGQVQGPGRRTTRVSDEFGEATTLTLELGRVLGQFGFACPSLLQ